jgi:hypothetical protein
MSDHSQLYADNGSTFMVLRHQGDRHSFPKGDKTCKYRPDGWHYVWDDVAEFKPYQWFVAVNEYRPAKAGDESNYEVMAVVELPSDFDPVVLNNRLMTQAKDRQGNGIRAKDDPRYWVWMLFFFGGGVHRQAFTNKLLSISPTTPVLTMYLEEAAALMEELGVGQ